MLVSVPKETILFTDITGVPQAKASASVMGSNVVGAHEQDGEILISLSVVNARIPTKAPFMNVLKLT